MRRFGTDKPEFMTFYIGDSDEVYKMPLAASLPAVTIRAMQRVYQKGDDAAFEFQLALLEKHIGDAVNKLTAKDVGEIFQEWNKQSAGQGAEVGESSASYESSTDTDELLNTI